MENPSEIVKRFYADFLLTHNVLSYMFDSAVSEARVLLHEAS